jgi:hypothetical protein
LRTVAQSDRFGRAAARSRALWRRFVLRLPPEAHPMVGDRCIEWEWVVRHLPAPPAKVLDIGCVDSITAGLAAVKGLDVTGVDLRTNPFTLPNLRFIRGSVEDADLPGAPYDCIVLCSTIEHVGLGGRYGETSREQADRRVMRRLVGCLGESGTVVVTIPVGRSALIAPYHRIYGEADVAALFDGLTVVESGFWKKTGPAWNPVAPAEAYATEGSKDYFALGLYLLRKRSGGDVANGA